MDVLRTPSGYDEDDAFICACKGEPYTADEWDERVSRLRKELADAESRWRQAQREGVCMPARFSS